MHSDDLVSINFLGKSYRVAKNTTLLGALIEIGWDPVKRLECLGECAGACAVLHRPPGETHVHAGLACRIPVQDGVSFSFVGRFPFSNVRYNLSEISEPKQALFDLYPEITTCRSCELCVQSCPQGIDVQRAMWCAVFGDFAEVADRFDSCVHCGFCARVCSVGIRPFEVALYVSQAQAAMRTEMRGGLVEQVHEVEARDYQTDRDPLQGGQRLPPID